MPRRGHLYFSLLNEEPTIIKIGKTMDLEAELKSLYKDSADFTCFYVECGNIDDYLRRFNNCMKKNFVLKDPLNTRIYISNAEEIKPMLCTVVGAKKCLQFNKPKI